MVQKCECKHRREYRSLVVSMCVFAVGVMSSFARGICKGSKRDDSWSRRQWWYRKNWFSIFWGILQGQRMKLDLIKISLRALYWNISLNAVPVFALPSVICLMRAIPLKLSLAKWVSDLGGVLPCVWRQEKSLSEKFHKAGKTALLGSKAYFFLFASGGTKCLKSLLINLLYMSTLHTF